MNDISFSSQFNPDKLRIITIGQTKYLTYDGKFVGKKGLVKDFKRAVPIGFDLDANVSDDIQTIKTELEGIINDLKTIEAVFQSMTQAGQLKLLTNG